MDWYLGLLFPWPLFQPRVHGIAITLPVPLHPLPSMCCRSSLLPLPWRTLGLLTCNIGALPPELADVLRIVFFWNPHAFCGTPILHSPCLMSPGFSFRPDARAWENACTPCRLFHLDLVLTQPSSPTISCTSFRTGSLMLNGSDGRNTGPRSRPLSH